MATATNPRDIFFEHEVAIQEEAAERAAEIESDRNVDWEALDNVADAMTSMVYKNINEKFQKSFFGQFIKPHFFEETSASKAIFEQGVYAYGFCVITYLTMKDIDFTVPNNPFTEIAEEFSDYNDLDQFFFILESEIIGKDPIYSRLLFITSEGDILIDTLGAPDTFPEFCSHLLQPGEKTREILE